MTAAAEIGTADIRGVIGSTLEAIQAGEATWRPHYGRMLLGFDLDQAMDLQPPAGNESRGGRSVSPVTWNEKRLGELVVTALAPGQRTTPIPPDSLEGVRYALHLPIATLVPDESGTTLHRLLNRLDIINSNGTARTAFMYCVGESERSFREILAGRQPAIATPDFTLTGGYRHGQRFGADATLRNSTDRLQIVGTIAVDGEAAISTYKPVVARAHKPNLA